jgi:hypothetical protein
MWSFQRYAKWLDSRTSWFIPGQKPEPPDNESSEPATEAAFPPVLASPKSIRTAADTKQSATAKAGGRVEIEVDEGGLEKILKKLQ